MSKRELTGLPLSDAEHANCTGLFTNIIQQTNDEALGGSQVWFQSGGVAYKASFERCTSPLKDLSGKNKTITPQPA